MNEAVLEGFRSARGSSCEWYTPTAIFDALGLEYDLDPCSPALPACPWIPARRRVSLPDDGLAETWAGRVWLNPPYGREETARWVGRLADHGHGIALIFARTDTPWWQRCAARASAVCFISGRVSFIAGDRGYVQSAHAGAPSCLLAYGEDCAIALERSGLGLTYREGHALAPAEGLFP